MDSICRTPDLSGRIMEAIHNIRARIILIPINNMPKGKNKRSCKTLSPENLKYYRNIIEIKENYKKEMLLDKNNLSYNFPQNINTGDLPMCMKKFIHG